MSERGGTGGIARFESPSGTIGVALGFDPARLIAEWAALRGPMARELPDAFARDEWAYLISFLEEGRLGAVFTEAFGPRASANGPAPRAIFHPVSTVAVWLPNNVSLLGPLTLVLLTLTGTRVRLKGGSDSEDLTRPFLEFARAHAGTGLLAERLADHVEHAVFGREDARNAALAAEADVRIVFGSDEATAAVDALPHRPGSETIAFRDRSSEAWVEPARIDEATLRTLLAVFAVYGQAGCTSPRRVVLIDGVEEDARALAERLAATWPRVVRRPPAPHESSQGVLGLQWARALGWRAVTAPDHAAVFAAGALGQEAIDLPMGLSLVPATEGEALRALPRNIQTVGQVLGPERVTALAPRLASRGVARLVPLARMHHFGPVWDGLEFWRRCFTRMEVEA